MIGYVDNLTVNIIGKVKKTATEVMQTALIIRSWCTINGQYRSLIGNV